ncbi:DUF692 domain-containing protein [Amylibacter sp. IMCC11727]|uniref:MNIO family bufferin maturase n=1 Tax=Amylibacter sp. IMCC11727 TaxID=3039851 RepID=UPI00244DD5E2|nr:DUF692 domain-containing protein [Amylibacter sp. IMCC11727]WGI20787.1 DUF692 domain-containing protein [Amylibacter sp. IMCC11727]
MLDARADRPSTVPNRAGVGFKAQHLDGILKTPDTVGWLEIHAENYMGDGGRPIAQLRHLREQFPISCHGVGLSIGAEGPLDADHLARLKKLVDWLEPGLFSEHLAWSTHDTHFLNDLLPVPYTQAVVDQVVRHIDQVQDTVGRQMLLENPSTYVAFAESDRSEIDFLTEVAKRSGCGLLLDVNNVFVSATNQNYSPEGYIDAFPTEFVGEIHLGGHEEDADDHGATLLIDSHSREVVDPVWALYEYTLAKAGPRPTLIEWDNDIPEWDVLAAEMTRADKILSAQPVAAV